MAAEKRIGPHLIVASLRRSEDYYEAAIELCKTLGDRIHVVSLMIQSSLPIALAGNHKRALLMLDAAESMLGKRASAQDRYLLWTNRGHIRSWATNFTQSVRCYKAAHRAAVASRFPDLIRIANANLKRELEKSNQSR
jgi:hypothetical protein